MSQMLKKHGREPEALAVSTDVWEAKRFHVEETDGVSHLPLLGKTLLQEAEEPYLDEELGTTCSTFYPSSNSGYNSASSDISSGQEGEALASDSGVELFYLLEASDDEFGIPLSPVLDFKDEIWEFPKETSEDLLENLDLISLSEIWHFEDDFENYQQFALYEDACEASELQDYMNRDFVNQDMWFAGEFSAAWTVETAGCL